MTYKNPFPGTGDPETPGWYAVLVCWDEQEGVFPMTDEWTDKGWSDRNPVCAWHGPLPDRESAKQYATENDPDS